MTSPGPVVQPSPYPGLRKFQPASTGLDSPGLSTPGSGGRGESSLEELTEFVSPEGVVASKVLPWLEAVSQNSPLLFSSLPTENNPLEGPMAKNLGGHTRLKDLNLRLKPRTTPDSRIELLKSLSGTPQIVSSVILLLGPGQEGSFQLTLSPSCGHYSGAKSQGKPEQPGKTSSLEQNQKELGKGHQSGHKQPSPPFVLWLLSWAPQSFQAVRGQLLC